MLKIKENIDLKELEKYGFKLVKQNGTYNGSQLSDFYELFVKDGTQDRTEYISFNCRAKHLFVDVTYPELSDNALDILFDLIQAGLVEKVENE